MRYLLLAVAVLAVLLASAPPAGAVNFTALQNAARQVGGTGWAAPTMGSAALMDYGMIGPEGVAVDSSGTVYVADTENNRMMRWAATPGADGAAMSTMLMKVGGSHASFVAACGNGSSNPEQITVTGDGAAQRLGVADRANHRVVLFLAEPTVDGTTGTVFLGQASNVACNANRGGGPAANTLQNPSSVWTDGTKVAIADEGNNRVLLWDTFPATGQAADRVLGQADFVSIAPDRGGAAGGNTLDGPHGVFFDGTYLYVADTRNNRVLVWNAWPAANGQAANWAIGQTNLTNSSNSCSSTRLDYPRSVAATGAGAGHRIAIGDQGNNRVTVMNAFPSAPASGVAAASVVGQAALNACDENRNAVSAAGNTLRTPRAVNFDSGGNLWVADQGNNRVTRYATLVNPTANRVLGHAGATSATASIPLDAGGGELALMAHTSMTTMRNWGARVAVTPTGTLFVADQASDALMQWNGGPAADDDPFTFRWGQATTYDAGEGGPGDNTTAILANNPTDVWTDGTRLLLSEEGHDRVLVWTTLPTSNNDPPDYVLGQANFTSSSSGVGQAALHDPGGVTSNGSDIAVSDRTNNRIMIWRGFFGAPANGKNADVVLGQPDFTGSTPGRTQVRMETPDELDLDQDVLAVADHANNRVLVWHGFSTLTTNEPADAVIGQTNFTNGGSGTIGEDATGLAVAGNAVIFSTDCNVYVVDPVPPSGAVTAAPVLGNGCSGWTLGQARYDAPGGVDAANGRVWVANGGHGRIMRWDDTTAPTITVAPAATVRCDGTVTVSWSTSESTTTEIYWDSVTRATYPLYANSNVDPLYSGLTHSYDLSFPTAGTYYARVRAVDWNAQSVVSGEINFTVPATCPAPTTMLADDANAQTGRPNPTSTTNAPPIRVVGFHSSWLQSSGVTMDRYQAQTWSTPPEHAGGLWHLNSAVTPDVNSANGSSITMLGVPGYAAGKFGQGIQLNGSTQYGTIPDAATIEKSNDFTVDAWFATTDISVSGFPTIVGKSNGGGCGFSDCTYTIEFDQGLNLLCASVERGAAETISCRTAVGLVDGQFHHAALVVSAANTLVLYVDGVAATAPVAIGGPVDLNNGPMAIGSASTGNNYFKGTIDEVRFSPTAYSAGAILGYYRTSRPHAQTLHDSAADPLGANCTTATRCTDAVYGAPVPGATDILRNGARYYVRTRFNTLNNDYWSLWGLDWLEVENVTSLTVTAGAAVSFGTVFPGSDSFGTSTVRVTTNAPVGYQLTAHDESDTWGLERIPATDTVVDRQNGAVAPAPWASGVAGFFGVTVRDAPGGRLAKWGTGTGTTEGDNTNNLYTALENTSEVVLHSRSTFAAAPEDILVTWRVNPAGNDAPGSYDGVVTLTAVANP